MTIRTLILIIACLLGQFHLNAQIETRQLSLKKPKLNVLYYNFENQVQVKNLPAKARVVFGDTIIASESDVFILMPKEEKPSRLYVYDSMGKVCFEKKFESRFLPPMNLKLNFTNVPYGILSTDEILKAPYLKFSIDESPLKMSLKIKSYKLGIYTKTWFDTTISGFDLNGIQLPQKVLERISKLENGDKIFLEDIRTEVDGRKRIMPSKEIKIAFQPNQFKHPLPSTLNINNSTHLIAEALLNNGESGYRFEENSGFAERLAKSADDSTLVQLMDIDNALVKLFSFEALCSHKSPMLYHTIVNHWNDTNQFEFGKCIVIHELVSDFFIHRLLHKKNSVDEKLLAPDDELKIWKKVLKDTSERFDNQAFFLRECIKNEEFHALIKKKVVEQKKYLYLYLELLAAYQDKKDIPFIKEAFEKSVYGVNIDAIAALPDSAFYEFAVSEFEYEWHSPNKWYNSEWPSLKALIKYPNKKTVSMLDRFYFLNDLESSKILLHQIEQNDHPIYADLKAKLKKQIAAQEAATSSHL